MLNTKRIVELVIAINEVSFNKVRDPKRIEELLGLIKDAWMKNPDLRFNQLFYQLQSNYSHENNGVGEVKEPEADGFFKIGFDLYNVEDDKFIRFLRSRAS